LRDDLKEKKQLRKQIPAPNFARKNTDEISIILTKPQEDTTQGSLQSHKNMEKQSTKDSARGSLYSIETGSIFSCLKTVIENSLDFANRLDSLNDSDNKNAINVWDEINEEFEELNDVENLPSKNSSDPQNDFRRRYISDNITETFVGLQQKDPNNDFLIPLGDESTLRNARKRSSAKLSTQYLHKYVFPSVDYPSVNAENQGINQTQSPTGFDDYRFLTFETKTCKSTAPNLLPKKNSEAIKACVNNTTSLMNLSNSPLVELGEVLVEVSNESSKCNSLLHRALTQDYDKEELDSLKGLTYIVNHDFDEFVQKGNIHRQKTEEYL